MTIRLWLKSDSGDRLEYAFGSDDDVAGRVAVHRASGDVEVLDLNNTMPPPGAKFYLASVVPRLHAYHDDSRFPESDTWEG